MAPDCSLTNGAKTNCFTNILPLGGRADGGSHGLQVEHLRWQKYTLTEMLRMNGMWWCGIGGNKLFI